MPYPTVIFSIDDTSVKGLLRFDYWCRDVGVFFNRTPLLGCYKGEQEPAFITSLASFDKTFRWSGFLANQESVLHVTGCNKMYAELEALWHNTFDGEKRKSLGPMQQVSMDVAKSHDAWTYRPDKNQWFICAHGNPDHSGDIQERKGM